MRQLQGCPVCRSDYLTYHYTGRTTRNPIDPATWNVWQCERCNHRFLNPQPTWEELRDYYHEQYKAYDPSHGLESDFDAVVQRARECGEYRHVSIRPGMRVLDVGCGGGSFLRVARELGAKVEGVEPSTVAAQRACQYGLSVFKGTLEQYAGQVGSDNLFDLVTFSHVIEHVPDPIETLATAGGLLNENGMIWVKVPNGDCRFARALGWRWHSTDLPLHLMHFSLTSIRVTAEHAGLSVRRLYTYSLPRAVGSSIILMLKHRWMIPARVGRRLVWAGYIARKAVELDRKSVGEAIIAELIREGSLGTAA